MVLSLTVRLLCWCCTVTFCASARVTTSTRNAVTKSIDLRVSNQSRKLLSMNRTAPDYYDSLRMNAQDDFMSVTKGRNSSIYNVVFSDGNATNTYRLAELKGVQRFVTDGKFIAHLINEGYAVLLAVYHFNNMLELGHPVLGDQVLVDPALSSCNVRLTMELFDGQQNGGIATRTISSVLRRPQSFQMPPVTAVVGASISSETMPLAVYTGAKYIPQISASATSTIFDDKEQFPLFGRTNTNTHGEGGVVARFFHSIGSTHVAIVFGTDTYISAMHEGFLNEAFNLGITTESLVYSDSTNANETLNVIEWLKRLQTRHVLVLCYEEALTPIMNTASDLGAVGPDYLYIFPCFDVTTHISNLKVKSGSGLSRALHGTALVQIYGGGIPDRIVTNKPATSLPDGDPLSTVDRFYTSWRHALGDSSFVEHVQRKLPVSLDSVPGFDRNAEFAQGPSGFLNFLYDAVTSLGISMCRAGANATFFSGEDIYNQFRQLDFNGASGRNLILNETGTRTFTTVSFIIWNVRITEEVSEGYSVIEYVPSFSLVDGSWTEIPGNSFVFADGSTTPPGSLPPVPFNFNYVGKLNKALAYSLMAIVMLAAVTALVWTVYYRLNHIVNSAQPVFLIMTGVGAFIMVSSIIPLSFDEETVASHQLLDAACMLTPWLYIIGTSIALSGLLAKAKAVHQAYMDPSMEEVQISSFDILKVASILLSVNILIMTSWSFTSPLQWTRVEKAKTDRFDRLLESYAVCASDHSIGFVITLGVANIAALLCGTIWAYRTRNIATEYNESRYIGSALAAVLQVWLMGVPVVFVLRKNPAPLFFVQSGLVIVTSGAIMLLVYLPKVITVIKDRGLDAQELRQIYQTFRLTSTMAKFDPEDDNDHSCEVKDDLNSDLPQPVPVANEGEGAQCIESGRPSSRRIKIIHNPRSTKNLQLSGGLELSLEQTKLLRMPRRRSSLSDGGKEVGLSSLSDEGRSLASSKSPGVSLFRVDEEHSATDDTDQRLFEMPTRILDAPVRRKSA